MTRWRSQGLWLPLLLVFALLGGCARCSQDQGAAAIATLSSLTGSGVTRDYAQRQRAWEPAAVGSRLALGDGAKTDHASTALLTFINGSTLALKPNTTVRLLLDLNSDDETALDVQAGEAVLRAGSRELSLRTHVGLATIAPESEIVLTRSGDTIGLEVTLGQLDFRDRDDAGVALRSGDSVRVGIGLAVLELQRAQSPTVEPLVDAGADASVEPDEATKTLAGPTFRHMLAQAGASFVVHTPEAPVSIGFDLAGKCPGIGVIELVGARQAVRGKDRVNVLLGVGIRSYTLRCVQPAGALGRIVARGSIHVLVDPGTRKLPPKAPTSQVDADGRTYRIYYQNQLPDVLVRWPQPPAVASYTLELDDKPIELSKPEHLFRSGTLGDGVHTLSFKAQSRRSRTTTVEVRFDNVAPKASLSAPDDRAFSAGSLVSVQGVALPSWKVALEGGTIEMGAGDRFSGQVQTSPESPYVSVRLSHPRLGTHYYLRRASETP
jgi:hypothetical protein